MVLQQESLLVFICCYTLLAPYAIGITKSTSLFIQEGPWEIALLKPSQLFRLFKPYSACRLFEFII
jgi:hypothetical protein